MIVTDDERLRQTLVSLRAHGWIRELPDQNFIHDKTGDPYEDSFCFALPGYNVRPVELSGAIGIEQTKKIPMVISERRRNGKYFVEVLSELADVRLQKETGESSWFGFSLVLEGALAGRRREVGAALTTLLAIVEPFLGGPASSGGSAVPATFTVGIAFWLPTSAA